MPALRTRVALIARRVKRWFCVHEVHIDRLVRHSPELVTAPCDRCGKVLRASYGLALPCRWLIPPGRYPRLQDVLDAGVKIAADMAEYGKKN